MAAKEEAATESAGGSAPKTGWGSVRQDTKQEALEKQGTSWKSDGVKESMVSLGVTPKGNPAVKRPSVPPTVAAVAELSSKGADVGTKAGGAEKDEAPGPAGAKASPQGLRGSAAVYMPTKRPEDDGQPGNGSSGAGDGGASSAGEERGGRWDDGAEKGGLRIRETEEELEQERAAFRERLARCPLGMKP